MEENTNNGTNLQPENNTPIEPNNGTNNGTNTNNGTKQTFTRNIVSVTQNDANHNRYYFEVDGEPFKALNKNGEEIENNSFSKNLITIMRQVGKQIPPLATGFAMSRVTKGGYLNPQFVALILQFAEITFEREYKEASAEADPNNPDDINGKDRYITTFKAIKLNIDKDFSLPLIIGYLKNPKQEGNELVLTEEQEQKKDIASMWDDLMK